MQVNNENLDDEDQGDEIGEYTPDVFVTEFVSAFASIPTIISWYFPTVLAVQSCLQYKDENSSIAEV